MTSKAPSLLDVALQRSVDVTLFAFGQARRVTDAGVTSLPPLARLPALTSLAQLLGTAALARILVDVSLFLHAREECKSKAGKI